MLLHHIFKNFGAYTLLEDSIETMQPKVAEDCSFVYRKALKNRDMKFWFTFSEHMRTYFQKKGTNATSCNFFLLLLQIVKKEFFQERM